MESKDEKEFSVELDEFEDIEPQGALTHGLKQHNGYEFYYHDKNGNPKSKFISGTNKGDCFDKFQSCTNYSLYVKSEEAIFCDYD